jgi:hypothetical protein
MEVTWTDRNTSFVNFRVTGYRRNLLITKCPFHPNRLAQQIGNYTLADLNSAYKIYKHTDRNM